MTGAMYRVLHRRIWGNVLLFAAISAISAGLIWIVSSDARTQIDTLATARSDKSLWVLAQAEVEFLALEKAALDLISGRSTDPDTVRRRFDVFYSRIEILKTSATFSGIRAVPEARAAMESVRGFLNETIPDVDGPDSALIEALPMILDRMDALRPELRGLALTGVEVLSEFSWLQRERVAGALRDIGLISFALLVVLLAVVAGLFHLTRVLRHRAEVIAGAQSHLRAIASTSIDAIVVVDRQGRLVDFNGAAEEVFGYSKSEAVGSDMAELIVPGHLRETHDIAMERFRKTGQQRLVGSGLLRLEAKRRDGSSFPVELSINSAQGENGEIFISFIRDISARIAAEKELVDARDMALAGEKAKANLLAVMSHEMRTPLNGVLGTLRLLAETDLDPKQRKYVNVMNTSGQLLLNHVNDVLDISRAESGKMDLALHPFDLVPLVRNIVDSLRGAAQDRGNVLRVVEIGPVPPRVIGDQTRLHQVLVNLLGNAIKFTRNGRIRLEVETRQGSDDIEFRVIDTGIGISKGDKARIFEEFVTLDSTYKREVEGTGLGLAIVNRIVDLAGGTCGVESEPGRGSVFWVKLPLPAVSEQTSDDDAIPNHLLPSSRSKAAAPRVLVVEDNEINRMVAREMLEKLGCRVVEAVDGQDGVDQARSKPFDLILMDVSMPRMDGLTAARKIQAAGANRDTPIVALTAHASREDAERFRNAGMADVLTKPLSKETVTSVLGAIFGGATDTRPFQPQNPELFAELCDTLGEEQAIQTIQRVEKEMAEGLVSLRTMLHGEEDGNALALAELAHRMAGSAALIGRSTLHTSLIAVETAARSSDRQAAAAALKTAEQMYSGPH